LNRYMNRTISNTVNDVDLILFMTDRLRFNEDDDKLLDGIRKVQCPVFLVINKVDELDDKEQLLPFIDAAQKHFPFTEVVPISALKERNTDALEATLIGYLPENPWLYDADQLTDRTARFLAAEFVREKITRQMGDELPHEVAVEIE